MNTKTMKIIMMLLGNLLLGIAVAILRMSRFGTDPFTCMNLGVSGFLNISFGTYQQLLPFHKTNIKSIILTSS